MRNRLCLLLLALAGVGIGAIWHVQNELPSPNQTQLYQLWFSALSLFAIPVSLLVFSFAKGIGIRLFILAWGIFLSILTLGVLAQVPLELAQISGYGLSFVFLILILSIGLVLFSSMEIIERRKAYNRPSSQPDLSESADEQIETTKSP